jgi:hypothetical protein
MLYLKEPTGISQLFGFALFAAGAFFVFKRRALTQGMYSELVLGSSRLIRRSVEPPMSDKVKPRRASTQVCCR